MHELSVTKSILDILLKHAASNDVSRIINVHLKIGELSDLEGEWIQRYFDYLSKGTVAQGAVIKIKKAPVQFTCDKCFTVFSIDIKKVEEIHCVKCGSAECTLKTGMEYYVEDMEVC
ncbi:MAG TPA: hydrogenase maturation nickel metallochaperone HypA [Spirochaetes bacterium]|nr:hydrogenase maturation nickel metallochaperone HypA [Spirochaetota bacterium]